MGEQTKWRWIAASPRASATVERGFFDNARDAIRALEALADVDVTVEVIVRTGLAATMDRQRWKRRDDLPEVR